MLQSSSFDFLSDMNMFKNFIKRKILFQMHNKIRKKMFLFKRRKLINQY